MDGSVITVVPALGDPHRERPPAVYGVTLPPISGHLSNADADSHLLVVSTVQRNTTFSVVVSTKNHKRAPQLATGSSLKFPCYHLVTNEQYFTSSKVMNHVIAASWLHLFYDLHVVTVTYSVFSIRYVEEGPLEGN